MPFADWIQGLRIRCELAIREFLRNRLFAQLWTDAVTGRSAGPTGRVYVDAYVRPAAMYRRYRALLNSPSSLGAEEIGRRPATVSLTRLVISSQQSGGPQKALDVAEASRNYVLEETITFDDVVQEYAPEDLKGDNSRITLPAGQAAAILGRMLGIPGWPVGEFLATAAPSGAQSPVLPVSPNGTIEFVLLYRFEGRSEARTSRPPLRGHLPEHQRGSSGEAISEEARSIRVDRGVSELARTSRVAPPGGPAPDQPDPGRRPAMILSRGARSALRGEGWLPGRPAVAERRIAG